MVHGPDDMDNPRRDPGHLVCLHGRVGWISAMVKAFLIIGLIALVVFIVVWLVAKRPHRR
jgi:hypothetical protein